MLARNLIFFLMGIQFALCYTNKLFTIVKEDRLINFDCDERNGESFHSLQKKIKKINNLDYTTQVIDTKNFSLPTFNPAVVDLKDPYHMFEAVIHQVVYGPNKGEAKAHSKEVSKLDITNFYMDRLAHWPSGTKMRAEIFHNKSSVHLPFSEYLHRGHAYLLISRDHMQTAVNAFAIFLAGSIEDIMRLPRAYVLQSARTIAMMRIAREKLATTWLVVKGSTPTNEVTYETLERFRPLFKYVNGKEMARLNLLDKRILSYIGTHPDLTRHQVGVVASHYTKLNPNWTQARYLNVMNNLLCGVPMLFMRGIPKHTYLQLTHQLFYHIRACDPLQRKFYLQMMTRTQALGKSYSWSARDVSRLGLLLAEVDAQSFSAINPEAMAGITSQVMSQIPTEVLLSVTEMQLRYMDSRSLNILAKKINAYRIQRATGAMENGRSIDRLHEDAPPTKKNQIRSRYNKRKSKLRNTL